MKNTGRLSAGLIAATCAFLGTSAFAEDAKTTTPSDSTAVPTETKSTDGKGQLEEIVVTAQRREERLQRVPISVNVVSAEKVESMGITGTVGLAVAVPNLNIMLSGSTTFNPFIRGVGSVSGNPNDEPSVATYIDGVYIAAPNAVSALQFSSIQRIEVLKGPQGTLFGRNATGGVIQIITKDPSETTGGNLDLSYAQYQTVTANGYITTGLAPGVAADLAVYYNDQNDGYGRNLITNAKTFQRKDIAVRSKLLARPSPSTTITLAGDYSKDTTHSAFQLVPGSIGIDGVSTYPGPFNSLANYPEFGINEQYGVSIKLNQELGAIRLVNIASYRHSNNLAHVDEDATQLDVVSAEIVGKQKNFSEELQILPVNSGKITWMAGLFYFDNKAGDDPAQIAGLAAAPLPYVDYLGIQHTKSMSAFAQATAEVLPSTKLTLGVRYTKETQNIHGYLNSVIGTVIDGGFHETTFKKPTWRIALDHEFAPEVNVYASYNRGIKSGGFAVFEPGSTGYAPEQLDAYEVGVKTDLFGHKLFLNISGFYYDYKNIQVTQAGVGFVDTVNAAAARIYGLDMDFQAAVTDRLRVSGGLGLLNSKFTKFDNAVTYGPNAGPAIIIPDASGNHTPLSSPVSGNLTAEYTLPTSVGDFRIGGTVSYNDGSYMDVGNRLRYPSYTLVNAYIGWKDVNKHLGARFWVNNLTNETYYIQRYTTALGDLQMQAPPRTVGGTLSVNF